jgi:AraC family transcriptional regulator
LASFTKPKDKEIHRSNQPVVQNLEEKKLIGIHLNMTFSNNRTPELWQNFMPRRTEITPVVGTELYAIQIYGSQFFENFDALREFTKWAAIEVPEGANVPDGMERFILDSGLYAVFHYIGDAKDAETDFRYILQTWLPNSGYMLDNRPHFELLGDKYRRNDPNSEEEIWIPIRPK